MAGGRVTKMLGQSLYFLTIDKSDLPDDQKRQQKGLDYAEVKIERDLLRVERDELKTALANERERNASGGFGPIQLKGDWMLAVEIDGFKEALIRGVAVENKKKLRHSKAEKEKNAAATLQDLASLQGDVEALKKQADPEKANEIAIKKKRLQDADKLLGDLQRKKDEVEAEEKRTNDMTPMDEGEEIVQAPTSSSEGENISSVAQELDSNNHAEKNPSRNDLSLAGGDDNNRDKENNGDSGSGNDLRNKAYPTPVPSDKEEDEMPVMTVSDKSRMGRSSTGREVIAWKPGGGRRGDVVITRYGPKSHPMFRIERASEVDGFDSEKLPDITNTEPQPYRIGERKQGRKWCYDNKHVDGIVAVAYTPMDEDKPLETINPAWYARHPKKRFAETQILIQWKNIAGEEGKKPRTWETRTTAVVYK